MDDMSKNIPADGGGPMDRAGIRVEPISTYLERRRTGRINPVVVVGASTAATALAWSVRSTFALFYVAILGELAWGRGPTALGYSLSWLGFVLFAPVAGWLSDRWGTRAVVTIGGGVLGVALGLT